MDLRQRVVDAYHRGEGSFKKIAERFDIGEATVNRWVRLARETGSVAPRPHGGGHPTHFHEEGLKNLRALVEEMPDATTYELTDAWHARGYPQVSRSALTKALSKKLGLTKKKDLQLR